MVDVCGFVIVFVYSFHCDSCCCGIAKWNFMGCVDEMSCLVVGREVWMWYMRGRCTLALMPS